MLPGTSTSFVPGASQGYIFIVIPFFRSTMCSMSLNIDRSENISRKERRKALRKQKKEPYVQNLLPSVSCLTSGLSFVYYNTRSLSLLFPSHHVLQFFILHLMLHYIRSTRKGNFLSLAPLLFMRHTRERPLCFPLENRPLHSIVVAGCAQSTNT